MKKAVAGANAETSTKPLNGLMDDDEMETPLTNKKVATKNSFTNAHLLK